MSIFYVLPPRPAVGDCLARFLQEFFPGLDWTAAERAALADHLQNLVADRSEVFVVHREDLPAGVPLSRALADGCGAEPGDEVMEIRTPPVGTIRPGLLVRRWALPTEEQEVATL